MLLAAVAGGRLADSAIDQTRDALNLRPREYAPDLSTNTRSFVDDVYKGAEDLIDLSEARAWDIFDEFVDDEDIDPDELDAKLQDGLDGIGGRALALASLAFTAAFSEAIQQAQRDAGVSQYIWRTMHDSHVRPDHDALDEQVCDWDDPPLTADKSDNGEDCHPGEDYNCRCVAEPIEPEEEE